MGATASPGRNRGTAQATDETGAAVDIQDASSPPPSMTGNGGPLPRPTTSAAPNDARQGKAS